VRRCWLEAGAASPVLSPQSMTEAWKHRNLEHAHRIASHLHLHHIDHDTAQTHSLQYRTQVLEARNHGHNSRDACRAHCYATYRCSIARRQPPHHLLPRTRTPQNTRYRSRVRHASMRRSPHNLRPPPFKCRLNLDHKHNLGQGTPRIG
jgi:hypothetical protein